MLLILLFPFSILGLVSRWFLTLALDFSFAFAFSWRWSLKTLGELQFFVLEFLHYGGKSCSMIMLGGHVFSLVVLPQDLELVQGGVC